MCAPCKVIINEEAANAALTMCVLRELVLQNAEPSEDSDVLYRMAEREVEFIRAKKQSAIEFAESIGAPDRWVELVRKL